jgi:FAD:protein FMN transferase
VSTVTATGTPTAPARWQQEALGTTALLLVTDPDALDVAAERLQAELDEIDRACSRFRDDSEITRLHGHAGHPAPVGSVLADALDTALRAAELTDGLVDPTVGDAVVRLGYDRDFAEVTALDERPPETARRPDESGVPAPGWWRVNWDRARSEVLLPRGVTLDLGATAKALAADRAAEWAHIAAGCGVLVSLGGDIAIAGDPPEGGWLVAISDDHRTAAARPAQTVALAGGGLATSSTTVRRWWRDGSPRHHIVDPRTGKNPEQVWRTVTVAAGDCVDANTASTAAIVLGRDAPDWLAERGLPARLVAPDGRVVCTADWPSDEDGD